MKCQFIFNKEKKKYICQVCGYETPYEGERHCVQVPNLGNRILNFTKAATQHALSGNPTVTKEVMKQRLKICTGCELFKPNTNEVGGICTHSSCGCTIQDNLNYLNKIAWADQKCPIDKWGETID
jgi:hypothetical protein